jgi:hypothetical protein
VHCFSSSDWQLSPSAFLEFQYFPRKTFDSLSVASDSQIARSNSDLHSLPIVARIGQESHTIPFDRHIGHERCLNISGVYMALTQKNSNFSPSTENRKESILLDISHFNTLDW